MVRILTFPHTSSHTAFWDDKPLKESAEQSDVERSVVLQSVFAISSALAYLLLFREQ